jgi:hypothetical protein
MKQAAFAIENPDERSHLTEECCAGVQESLNVYAVLVIVNPRDREVHLDNFIQQRDAQTLTQFVKERAMMAWKN